MQLANFSGDTFAQPLHGLDGDVRRIIVAVKTACGIVETLPVDGVQHLLLTSSVGPWTMSPADRWARLGLMVLKRTAVTLSHHLTVAFGLSGKMIEIRLAR